MGKSESTTRKLKPERKAVRDKQRAVLSGKSVVNQHEPAKSRKCLADHEDLSITGVESERRPGRCGAGGWDRGRCSGEMKLEFE